MTDCYNNNCVVDNTIMTSNQLATVKAACLKCVPDTHIIVFSGDIMELLGGRTPEEAVNTYCCSGGAEKIENSGGISESIMKTFKCKEAKDVSFCDKLPGIIKDDPELNCIIWGFIAFFALMMMMNMMPR
jgi:hypothetical protein